MAEKPLSDLEEAFARQYLVDLNATQAYLRVKPKVKETTARTEASKLLAKPNVAAFVAELRQQGVARLEITRDRVLRELAAIGFSNMRDFATWGPAGVTLSPSDQMADADARCVAEVTEKVGKFGRAVHFKLHDKRGALDKMGQHLGLWEGEGGKTEVSFYVEVPSQMSPAEWAARYGQGAQTPAPQPAKARR